MSTSSLTALPSSFTEKSDGVEVPQPPKPARKTYGRRREPTPPADDAGPSISSMFTSRSPPRPTQPVRESPSKALLNRWSTGDASWKASLLDLGLGKEAEDEDDEVDAEEIQREIALMRAKARGEKSSPKRVELPAPTHDCATRKFHVARLQPTMSSSTLTTAPPTSPLRSSPPPTRTIPAPIPRVSSPVADKAQRASELANLFDTSSDHEEPPATAKERSSSPNSHRSATSTPATRDHRGSRRSARSSPRSDASRTPSRASKTKKNRLDAFMADLDGSDTEPDPTPQIGSRAGSSPNVVNDFLATLQQSDDEDEPAKINDAEPRAKTSSVGLFDDEEEEREKAVRAGKSGIKGLKKAELDEMRRDIARNQRNKRVDPFKPQVDCLPISSWAANAAALLSSKPPALVTAGYSPVTSPHQVTPEEITAFTPSSTARTDQKRPANGKRQMIVPGTSSPTPLVPDMQEETNVLDEDEETKPLPSFGELMAEDMAKIARAEEVEARRRILQRRKQEQLKNIKWTGGRDDGNSDDELSILPKALPAVRFVDIKPSTSRNARNVLENFVNSSASSRRAQAVLQFTGKRSSGTEELTETMVEFAGKTFKHGDLKNMNSRPAGQKANKSKPITARDLDVMMREKHRLQAQKIQQIKEKAFGIRKRPVPSRETIDLEAQIEELRAREASRQQYDDEEEEDEDEEDEDYQGSGEEEDVEADEEEVQYSGDEAAITADGPGADQESEAENEVNADQENQPLSRSYNEIAESIERDSPVKVSSLPDQYAPRSGREPLAEVHPTQIDDAPIELDSTFVDISGFGSGGGSPGFSQLFEATQVSGATGTDAFAGLREQPAALMPIHAMLPQVDISATQIERDNAMIAAETEGDLEVEDDRPKTQYMNDRGLFTQTKPLPRPHVEASSSRNNLAGSSSLFEFAPQSAPEIELSSTQRGTSEGDNVGTGNSASPQRQRSPSTASSEDEGEVDVESRPTDAFAKLMAAGQRPLTKHQKQAKARIRLNLVDEQADESDEDNWLMPGQKNEEDEEDDGDDDAFLPDLVNDENISEEDRMRQDALVAQKNREIQLADDAKREAEARKVIEGQYRTKRRGKDFYSDDEDGTPRKKRWSKKQMRQRKIWKEDGLDKLDGEENVFMKLYEKDLDSDVESVDEAPSPRKLVQSPVKLSESERRETIRRVAAMNKSRDEDDIEMSLDQELDLDQTVDLDTDTSDVEILEETQYSVSRVSRHSEIIKQSTRSIRSTESYQNFVRDESLITRRVGTIGGASVVYNSKEILPARPGFGSRQYNGRPPVKAGSGSSGSILLSKTNKFA